MSCSFWPITHRRTGGRIVIFSIERSDVLQKIHSGHQGIGNAETEQCYGDLEMLVNNCKGLLQVTSAEIGTNDSIFITRDIMAKCCIDLFEWNKTSYLLIVLCKVSWTEPLQMRWSTAWGVFSLRCRIPKVIASDNGQQKISAELSAELEL